MKKSILELKGVEKLTKEQLKTVNGGNTGGRCTIGEWSLRCYRL